MKKSGLDLRRSARGSCMVLRCLELVVGVAGASAATRVPATESVTCNVGMWVLESEYAIIGNGCVSKA